jgi:serine/threonine-protein kinase
MTTEIRLANGVWSYDEAEMLGSPGGFGEVFRGRGAEGKVAVKRLKLTAGAAAHRELQLGASLSSRELKNVVPVLDYGQDAESDRYFLVMPICEYSLQEYISKKVQLDWTESCIIAVDIINGLMEVSDIVHRDMKPGNILWHDGRWKIADFGIAKFVEDNTSLETLRTSLSPQYAAPEQWLLQRPTPATDVYALACIIYAMLNGSPPFVGDVDTIRDGHLKVSPEIISGVHPRINGLVQSMLRKTEAARPSLRRCKEVISSIHPTTENIVRNALAEAGLQIASKRAQDDANHLSKETQRAAIDRQTNEAIIDIIKIFWRTLDEISNASDDAIKPRSKAPIITLGPAELSFAMPERLSLPSLEQSKWVVLAFTKIQLQCTINRVTSSDDSEYKISSSIVYARPPLGEDFRWFEVSFWSRNGNFWREPFALSPNEREFDIALSNTIGICDKAFGPFAIDAEDEQSFQDRWLGLFARAASGKLRPPNQMPPPDEFYFSQ